MLKIPFPIDIMFGLGPSVEPKFGNCSGPCGGPIGDPIGSPIVKTQWTILLISSIGYDPNPKGPLRVLTLELTLAFQSFWAMPIAQMTCKSSVSAK